MYDYMPANALFLNYQSETDVSQPDGPKLPDPPPSDPPVPPPPPPSNIDWPDLALWKINPEWLGNSNNTKPAFDYYIGAGGDSTRYAASDTGGFVIPSDNLGVVALNQRMGVNHRRYNLFTAGDGGDTKRSIQAYSQMQRESQKTDNILHNDELADPLLGRPALLKNKPENWPTMEVHVLRMIYNGKFVNLNRVIMTDSITGKTIQLSFAAFGTTLRGARQQRAEGAQGTPAGWADPFSITPSRNLDSP
jgi:hypothetical protein